MSSIPPLPRPAKFVNVFLMPGNRIWLVFTQLHSQFPIVKYKSGFSELPTPTFTLSHLIDYGAQREISVLLGKWGEGSLGEVAVSLHPLSHVLESSHPLSRQALWSISVHFLQPPEQTFIHSSM